MIFFNRKSETLKDLSHLTKAIKEKLDFSPDMWELEQHHKQHLFSYSRNSALEAAPYVSHAYTFDKFQLWEKDNTPIPLVGKPPIKVEDHIVRYRGFAGVVPKRISGRVISLAPKAFLELDKLKENGVQFYRKRVRLILPYTELQSLHNDGTVQNSSESKITFVGAWMYIGVKSYWYLDLKTSQDMREVSKVNKAEKIGEYYDFDHR